jgi:hypothetical protein
MHIGYRWESQRERDQDVSGWILERWEGSDVGWIGLDL